MSGDPLSGGPLADRAAGVAPTCPVEPVRCVAASPADAAMLLPAVERAGYRIRRGLPAADPGGPTNPAVVLICPVSDARAADVVIKAAARGASVLVVVDPATPLARAVVAGLSRRGAVQLAPAAARTLRVPGPADTPITRLVPGQRSLVDRLAPEQRALLDRLANGETIAAAAAAEFLSLRTANRRIAGVRHLFGVRTTREAVRIYLRQRGTG